MMSGKSLNLTHGEELRKKLVELLKLSKRTTASKRETLCDEIGINIGDIPQAMLLADDDFAKRVIKTLLDRKLERSIYQLCETLEPDFPNGIYYNHLIEIKTKIKCELEVAQYKLTGEVAHTQQQRQEPTERKPFYSLLHPQNFDLTTLLRDCVNVLDDRQGLIGLAVPYEKREFPKYFCNRLKDNLGKKDIRILETTLKPQINSVDRVLNQTQPLLSD